MMRVLIVHPHILQGGAETAVVYLAHHLEKLGIHAEIATLSTDFTYMPPEARGLVYHLPKRTRKPIPTTSLRNVARLLLLETFALRTIVAPLASRFDLINPHNAPAPWATSLLPKHPPVVWMCNEVFDLHGALTHRWPRNLAFRAAVQSGRMLDRRLVRLAVDRLVSLSKYHARQVYKRYGTAPDVVHPGVDVEFFRVGNPERVVRKFGLKDCLVLLHVGMLIPSKGQELSLRATALLRSRYANVKLVLVGRGPDEKRLQTIIQKLGLGENIMLLEFISQEDLRDLFHASHINLFPVSDQSWGAVPFQAMLGGAINIISTDCGAAEVVEEQQLGITLGQPSPQALADAVIGVWTRYAELQAELVPMAKRYVEETLTWENYARGMADVYRDVISRRL